MKDRLLTLAGGLLALYLVVVLLTPQTTPDFSSYPRSNDSGRHGLSILYHWLQRENIRTLSLRKRFDELLNDPGLPERGNLLIMHLPLYRQLRDNETGWLRSWLAQGNTLLLLAAHSDYPEWAAIRDFEDLAYRFTVLSDLGFNIEQAEAEQPADENAADKEKDAEVSVFNPFNPPGPATQTDFSLVANHDSPLLQGVASVEVSGQPYAAHAYRLVGREDYRSVLPLLDETGTNSPALWQARIGQGTVFVSRFGSLLGNDTLTRADNAQLVMNLVQLTRGDAGSVILDDVHQGLSEIYDPDAFYEDPRLHNTLWFLFGIWLLYLVGHSNRIAPPPAATLHMHAVDFVRAVGGLFARRLSRHSAAQAMFKHFFNDIRVQYGLIQNGEPTWEILERAPRVPETDLHKLRQYYHARDNHAPKLAPLHNLLLNTRKHLS